MGLFSAKNDCTATFVDIISANVFLASAALFVSSYESGTIAGMNCRRLRTVLACSLLLAVPLAASEKPAVNAVTEAACSDENAAFPSCQLPHATHRRAAQLFREARHLAHAENYPAALDKLHGALALSPRDVIYQSTARSWREKYSAVLLHQAQQALLDGQSAEVAATLHRALTFDPNNQAAAQQLAQIEPAATPPPLVVRESYGEVRLAPQPGAHAFEFRGDTASAWQSFARLFGLTATMDDSLQHRPVRLQLDAVDFETGAAILQRATKALIVPLADNKFLVASDTEENRRNLVSLQLRTFRLAGAEANTLNELASALRVLFDARFVTINTAQSALTVRAPQATMDAIAQFLDSLQQPAPEIMLDLEVYSVSTTFDRDIGAAIPDEFTIFNVPTELLSLTSSSSYEEILEALASAGSSSSTATILAALLASGSSSVLTEPFGVFGGGITLTGVTIPTTTLHLSKTNSYVQTIQRIQLRSNHGAAATLKIGQRYPIATTQYSTSTYLSSLLSALGYSSSSSSSSTYVPSPQITFEDLGIVLKTTPHVEGGRVKLDLEFTLRSLGSTNSTGLPIINNQELKSTISARFDETVAIAGLLSKDQVTAISGLPLLSSIPVISNFFTYTSKEEEQQELLILLRPHLVSARDSHELYLKLPTNVPK